jgi:hypothetical protein
MKSEREARGDALMHLLAVMPELLEDSKRKDQTMPFSTQLEERTKQMFFDSWVHKQLKNRKDRLTSYPKCSREWLDGYEAGLVDAYLDCKNEAKRLNR